MVNERETLESRRSRSRSKTPMNNLISRNPYINFFHDFRKRDENRSLFGKSLFIKAGEAWRCISEVEKEDYKKAAKNVKMNKIKCTKKNKFIKKEKEEKGFKENKKFKNQFKKRKHQCSRCGHRNGYKRNNSPTGFSSENTDF